MIFAHAYLGVFLARFLEKQFEITKTRDRFYLWVFAIVGAVFPDSDIAYLMLTNPAQSHRAFYTHTPIFYGVIGLIAAIYIFIRKPPLFHIYLTATFLLGALVHIASDAFIDVIYPFLPFSHYALLLNVFPVDKTKGFIGYVETPYFAIEIGIIISSLLLLIISYRKDKNHLKLLLLLLGTITLAATIALIPFISKF